MNNFFSLELSQEMQAAGCVSDSPYWHIENMTSHTWYCAYVEDLTHSQWNNLGELPTVQAFHLSDFLSPSPQARENCRIWWPESYRSRTKCPDTKPGCIVIHSTEYFISDERRHELLNLDTTQESIDDFMKRTRRKG